MCILSCVYDNFKEIIAHISCAIMTVHSSADCQRVYILILAIPYSQGNKTTCQGSTIVT